MEISFVFDVNCSIHYCIYSYLILELHVFNIENMFNVNIRYLLNIL